MKWGVRKSKLPRKARKARNATKDMTTQDLERKVKRFRLEADYKKYTTKDTSRAKNIVQTLVVGAIGAASGVIVRDLAKKGMTALSGSPIKKEEFIWDLIK